MDIGVYYQILDSGIQYEKGRKRGTCWRPGERKYLRQECRFWRKLLAYISDELAGDDCADQTFDMLEHLCSVYEFPNYENILAKKQEMIGCKIDFVQQADQEKHIRHIMRMICADMEQLLGCRSGKKEFYQLLAVLHNLPKCMHGKIAVYDCMNPISYKDALRYADQCLRTQTLREKYREMLQISEKTDAVPAD